MLYAKEAGIYILSYASCTGGKKSSYLLLPCTKKQGTMQNGIERHGHFSGCRVEMYRKLMRIGCQIKSNMTMPSVSS